MYACIVLYRPLTSDRVFAEGDDGKGIEVREFPSRDAAIAYVEEEFGADIPCQIVELDEL